MFNSILKLFGFSKKRETKISNRSNYKKLTSEIINSTTDDDLLQIVVDNLIEKYADYNKKRQEIASYFNPSRQAIYLIWLLDAEVNNGGFNQYYFNSKGKFATLIPGALKLVGAHHLSELVIKANSIYETENETITKYQDGTLEGFSKSYQDNPLNALGGEFYELNKIEDLSKLQVDFIRRNSADFVD